MITNEAIPKRAPLDTSTKKRAKNNFEFANGINNVFVVLINGLSI